VDEEEKEEKKLDGETLMIGYKYKLPKLQDIKRIKITKNGVVKTTKNDPTNDKPIERIDNFQIKILEREFYKPSKKASGSFYEGDSIPMVFKNKGKDTYILSGRKHAFDSFLLKRGIEERIDIKPNLHKQNQFGLAQITGDTKVGQREFQTVLFEAPLGLVSKVKKVEIDKDRIVTLITVDGKKYELEMDRETTFDELDRLSPNYWLNLIATGRETCRN